MSMDKGDDKHSSLLIPCSASYPMVPGALSLGVKRPDREAGHSLPSSAEVKE
jgi:hypothetical protein